jgi:hypothetical protein
MTCVFIGGLGLSLRWLRTRSAFGFIPYSLGIRALGTFHLAESTKLYKWG